MFELCIYKYIYIPCMYILYINKDQYTKSSFHMLMQAPVTPATHMRSKKDCTCTSSVSIATRCEQCLYAWQNKYWLHLIVSRVTRFPVHRTSAHAVMSHVTNHAAWAQHHLSGPCMPAMLQSGIYEHVCACRGPSPKPVQDLSKNPASPSQHRTCQHRQLPWLQKSARRSASVVHADARW